MEELTNQMIDYLNPNHQRFREGGEQNVDNPATPKLGDRTEENLSDDDSVNNFKGYGIFDDTTTGDIPGSAASDANSSKRKQVDFSLPSTPARSERATSFGRGRIYRNNNGIDQNQNDRLFGRGMIKTTIAGVPTGSINSTPVITPVINVPSYVTMSGGSYSGGYRKTSTPRYADVNSTFSSSVPRSSLQGNRYRGSNLPFNHSSSPGGGKNDKSFCLTQSFIKHSSTKLPKFQPKKTDVTTWLALCEIIFDTNGVDSDDDKFSMILSTFSPEDLVELGPFLASGNPSEYYANLKKGIMKLFSPTNQERVVNVYNLKYDGIKLPSTFFHELKNSIGGVDMGNETLRHLFLRRMSPLLRTLLAKDEDKPNREFLEIADSLFLSSRDSSEDLVESEPKKPNENSATNILLFQSMSQLQNKISELSSEMKRGNEKTYYSDRGLEKKTVPVKINSKKNNFQKGDSRGQIGSSGYCFWHDKFQDRAHSCLEGCKWELHRARREAQDLTKSFTKN